MARRPGPSFRALLFRCGEGAVCEPSRLEDRQLRELVFLSVQKATFGTGGRGPQARSVLQGPAVSVWRRRRLWAFAAGRQTAQRASFLVGSESNARHWGPWSAVSVRPSEFRCLVKPPFVINSARSIGRCDTAFRWAYDAWFEFGRKLLLNAPPCRMLDMCAHVCDLQARHSQREIVCRSRHHGGDRFALSSQCFAQIWRSAGRGMCTRAASVCWAPQQAAGSMNGQHLFWFLLFPSTFV